MSYSISCVQYITYDGFRNTQLITSSVIYFWINSKTCLFVDPFISLQTSQCTGLSGSSTLKTVCHNKPCWFDEQKTNKEIIIQVVRQKLPE